MMLLRGDDCRPQADSSSNDLEDLSKHEASMFNIPPKLEQDSKK